MEQNDDFLETVLGDKPTATPQQTKTATSDPVLSELKKQTALLGQIASQQEVAKNKLRSIAASAAIIAILTLLLAVFGFKFVIF